MSDIQIRPYEKADTSALIKIIKNNLREVNAKDYDSHIIDYLCNYFSESKIESMANERQMIVAIIDNEPVGTASLHEDVVYTVFVDCKQHGKGIGRLLMGEIELLAREDGVIKLKVPASITAEGFYEGLGYQRVDSLYDPDTGKVYIMEKVI